MTQLLNDTNNKESNQNPHPHINKITMVMAGDEEGGLEKHVVELSNGLASRGYQVSVIAHEKYKDRLSQHIQFVPVDLSKSRRNPLVLWQLFTAIKITQPDILHVQANKAVAMVAPLLKWLKIPSVATLHSRKKNTNMFKPFDAVIAVSPNAAEAINHFNKFVVLNGIEPPILNSNIAKSIPPVVLAVGRLVPVKGFDVLIKAWEQVENAELWIVGDGFEQENLLKLVNELNLSHSVKFLGFRSDIAELMQQASLYVMSSHYEGCPYTMVESLLCKTPMISTAVGAMTMVLPEQYLCPQNDVVALHDLIVKSLNRLDQLNQDFQSVFTYAEKNLVLNGMIENIEKVYQQVSNA